MRCGRAQTLMTAAVDRELTARRSRAFDRHLERCPVCRRELTTTQAMLGAVAGLPTEASVSDALAQATLRRVRQLAAEEDEATAEGRWWTRFRVPSVALATAAVIALAFGIFRSEAPGPGVAPTAKPADGRVARVPKAPTEEAPATQPRAKAIVVAEVPAEPPAELASSPDLFMTLPILRNLEKLENFEAIHTTTVEEPVAPHGEEPPSNG